MTSELFYDYQFIAKTSEDMKFVRAMSDMMQGLPNPVGLGMYPQGRTAVRQGQGAGAWRYRADGMSL